jgi:hypothetical protein
VGVGWSGLRADDQPNVEADEARGEAIASLGYMSATASPFLMRNPLARATLTMVHSTAHSAYCIPRRNSWTSLAAPPPGRPRIARLVHGVQGARGNVKSAQVASLGSAGPPKIRECGPSGNPASPIPPHEPRFRCLGAVLRECGCCRHWTHRGPWLTKRLVGGGGLSHP